MSNETITADDLVVLGNAAPDELRDLRKSVCIAGYSPRHGMIRIYPVPPTVKVHRWYRLEATLERNSQDVRKESWKLKGSHDGWSEIDKKISLG